MVATMRRETRQKRDVRHALLANDHFVSAQQLYAQLRAEGSRVGLATVYRNLNEMVRNEEADSFDPRPSRRRPVRRMQGLPCVGPVRAVKVSVATYSPA